RGSTCEPGGVGRRTQPSQPVFPWFGQSCRTLVGGRGSRKSGALRRSLGGVFESGRRVGIGSDSSGSEMPGATIVASEGCGERSVRATPIRWVGSVIEGCADQRMPELESARSENQEPRRFSRLKRIERKPATFECLLHDPKIAGARGGGYYQRMSRRLGKRFCASAEGPPKLLTDTNRLRVRIRFSRDARHIDE